MQIHVESCVKFWSLVRSCSICCTNVSRANSYICFIWPLKWVIVIAVRERKKTKRSLIWVQPQLYCKRLGSFACQDNRRGFQTEHNSLAALYSKTVDQMFGNVVTEELVVVCWSCICFQKKAFTLEFFVFWGNYSLFPFLVIFNRIGVKPFHDKLQGTHIDAAKKQSSCAAKIWEIIGLRAQGWTWKWHKSSIGLYWHGNVHTCPQNTCKVHTCEHTQADKRMHAHTKLLYLVLSFSPVSRADRWGGRRGLATGAGQRNSRLFTFFPFSPLCFAFSLSFPLSSSTPYIPLCSLFPSEDVGYVMKGQRHNYTKRVKGRVASQVFTVHCNAVQECRQQNLDEWLWRGKAACNLL